MSSPLSDSVGHCGRGFYFSLALAVSWVSSCGLSRFPREVGCEVEAALEQFEELGHHPCHLVLSHRAR